LKENEEDVKVKNLWERWLGLIFYRVSVGQSEYSHALPTRYLYHWIEVPACSPRYSWGVQERLW